MSKQEEKEQELKKKAISKLLYWYGINPSKCPRSFVIILEQMTYKSLIRPLVIKDSKIMTYGKIANKYQITKREAYYIVTGR